MVGTPPASIVDPAEQARRDADDEQKRLADSHAAAREAALAEAQAAEEEAAAASNDRDVTTEHVRAALARAAKARANAHPWRRVRRLICASTPGVPGPSSRLQQHPLLPQHMCLFLVVLLLLPQW
ncbi:hypothetical protein GUJ93_ZPchr0007g4886 [Zizania palustris]|uniref:Uncharacterized protein n=1 Tax=Zizania palustris TaxID=103762 RepID=A0A8J5W011_ZIZPA|nr:hypothetical protein GUJ93_ZPchr0007g4886 [Zizania palustris]